MLTHRLSSGHHVRPKQHSARRTTLTTTVLALTVAGCAARTTPARSTATPAMITSGTGWVTVAAPPGQPDAPALRIRGAALFPGAPDGGEELRMTVTNDSGATEHLYAITSAHSTSSELFTAPTSPSAQPQPAPGTGVTLPPGASTVFGPGGPRILLQRPIGLAPGRPVALTLAFALAGLVQLTAAPTGSPPHG